MIEILFLDDHLVVVNKPHDILVHRTSIAAHTSENVLYALRDQLGKYLYPVHRLDSKTSGCLVFTLTREANVHLSRQFAERQVSKEYIAVVRGYTLDEGTIDYPIQNEKGKLQDAYTEYRTKQRYEIPVPHGKHMTSRYSLVSLHPTTGRMHQLRRHMAHVRHPIIGDRPHGCNKQNRLWKHTFSHTTMLLHAHKLAFQHPDSDDRVELVAPLQEEFERAVEGILMGSF